ncbi:MAG TPA: hypothetical protein VIF37_08505 [Methylobacter sp.]
MSTTAWMQEVEQRRSSCRGAEAFTTSLWVMHEVEQRETQHIGN